MKNDCNVVRDLMPLVIDGVASEESQTLVEAHVSACEECTKVYGELQQALPAQERTSQEIDFVKAARILHTWRLARQITAMLLAVVLTVGAVWGVWALMDRHDRIERARLDVPGLEMYLVRFRDGSVRLFYDPKAFGDRLIYNRWEGHGTEDGALRSYNGWNTTERHKQHDLCYSTLGTWVNGQIGDTEEATIIEADGTTRPQTWEETVLHALYIIDPKEGEHLTDRLMKNEPVLKYLVYREGQDIPLCSPELEAYYEVWGMAKGGGVSEEERAAYEQVPEFK